ANQPAYSRASTPHPPSTMMWQTFLPSLLCLFLQLKFCLSLRQCRWLVALSETKNIEGLISSYIYQEELRNVAEIFRDLKDSPIDPSDKDAGILFLDPARILSKAWKTQDTQMDLLRDVLLSVSPDSATCDSEEICKMFWFAPMPFLNGSVVHHVLVKTNGFGLPILNKLFYININGFMEPFEKLDIFRIGNKSVFSLSDPSRPLWATYRKAPVVILGGIPEKKIVIVSETNFDTYHLIESHQAQGWLNPDCWETIG
uniref:Uncharacterized protein n=1 Tax=Naja naja TaxID=35670 RepID=A0A8C6VPY4_NAJNA